MIPKLKAIADALPDEYDPAYRLAWLLFKAGKPDAALLYAKRALAKVYGPRTKRVKALITQIEEARQ